MWRWAAARVLVWSLAMVLVRKPLAGWLWPDTRAQRMLDEAAHALRQGRLTAADGSGARAFEAAQALDPTAATHAPAWHGSPRPPGAGT